MSHLPEKLKKSSLTQINENDISSTYLDKLVHRGTFCSC